MKLFQIPMVVTSLAGLCFLAGLGVPAAHADFTFGQPANLGPTVNSSMRDISPCVPYDGLELYFSSDRGGGIGGLDLWVSTRPAVEDDWGPPRNLGSPVNSSAPDLSPSISADGLELYFHANDRSGGFGAGDIWVTRRTAKDLPWSTPENLGAPINTPYWDYNPSISADGLALYFAPDSVLSVARRATKDSPWEAPVPLNDLVNNWECQDTPSISSDDLVLVYTDNVGCTSRPGGFGGTDIWLARRANPDADWEAPVNVGPPVNTAYHEDFSMICPDGSALYFESTRPGGSGNCDLWQAPILPITDFNGDGQVDEKELRIMVAYWDTNDLLCDIGPMPWGDGVVDIQDLKVLADSIGKEVFDPTLVAHWALDETEGTTAHDSAGDHDAAILGAPLWRPEGGRIGGALELSGVPNLAATSFVRDPSQGPLSVFAWVKGGAPGQVVVSQKSGGANWLMASADGALMTELQSGGRITSELTSTAVITDGDWHRIGLTWDGVHRTLYVDDEAVAADTQTSLAGSTGDLLLGASAKPGAGSFWKGLIDDVRIYSRAVKP